MALDEDLIATPPIVMAHQTRLASLPELTDLVLLIRDDVPGHGQRFCGATPGVRVHVLGARRDLDADELTQLHSGDYQLAKSEQARIDYLARISRPQAIIEAGNKKRAAQAQLVPRPVLLRLARGLLFR